MRKTQKAPLSFVLFMGLFCAVGCKTREHTSEVLALPDANEDTAPKKTKYTSAASAVAISNDEQEFTLKFTIKLNENSQMLIDSDDMGIAELAIDEVSGNIPESKKWLKDVKSMKLYNTRQNYYCEKTLFCSSFRGGKDSAKSREEVSESPDVLITLQEAPANSPKDILVVIFNVIDEVKDFSGTITGPKSVDWK